MIWFGKMQKHNENLFSEKFRLLNSQEHVEEIKWSSSESSDVENNPRKSKFSTRNSKVQRKRKRKKTEPKNLSNLSITIVDTSKDLHDVNSGQISPILQVKSEKILPEKSPTFAPNPSLTRPHKCLKIEQSSPVLTCKMSALQSKLIEKSPILLTKHISPKVSPNVRKNLFKATQSDDKSHQENASQRHNQLLLDRRKSEEVSSKSKNYKITASQHESAHQNPNLNSNSQSLLQLFEKSESIFKPEHLSPLKDNLINPNKIEIPESQEEIPQLSQQNLDDSFTLLKTSNTELVKRAKSYFENHFSSNNASQSQHSISDCLTQNNFSKSSDEVEIISITTQLNSNKASFQSEQGISKNPSPISSQSAEFGTEKMKKIRYKRDGLAFRLNTLIKKQNANISLWQHERFLADNSNFRIPKGEHSVFLIQKVTLKFGSYLLEGIDVSDSNVLILISSLYVQELNICENMVFKLYEPYKILLYKDNCKLIINVCKFECIAFKE